ncbi:hypothetical protein LTR70_001986 [Exophiala xenobiotica]|uniref:BTB domain-containing protein n=1 Tax=Lithohypha guttulata TaxID=1690604 RepID=A0ABR0JXI9_9EURO|nr:hypothetical protein LTR24_009409 [Lithohypha guttulata]KAK5326971.1 hypothetical protein LTR70_001986 [Exophiala xenobiotica]
MTPLNPYAYGGPEIFQAQKKLLETGTFSDLTIHCGGTVWHVHRAVLAPRCAFFDMVCSGEFAEAESQVVELPEDDPEAVDTMLQYLYTLVVPSLNTSEKARKAFEIADKYDLTNVSVEARRVLLSVFQGIYSPAAGFGVPQATYKPAERLDDYWTWIQQCPGDTTEFREALAKGCATKVSFTTIQEELIKYASENPEFGVLFMRKLEERAMMAEDALIDMYGGHRRLRRHRGLIHDG